MKAEPRMGQRAKRAFKAYLALSARHSSSRPLLEQLQDQETAFFPLVTLLVPISFG